MGKRRSEAYKVRERARRCQRKCREIVELRSVWLSENSPCKECLRAGKVVELKTIRQVFDHYRAHHKSKAPESALTKSAWLRAHGPCVQCGSKKRLEVDHVLRITKTRFLWSCIWKAPPFFREIELAKCQALCRRCHEAKTLAEQAETAQLRNEVNKVSDMFAVRVRAHGRRALRNLIVYRLSEVFSSALRDIPKLLTQKVWKEMNTKSKRNVRFAVDSDVNALLVRGVSLGIPLADICNRALRKVTCDDLANGSKVSGHLRVPPRRRAV